MPKNVKDPTIPQGNTNQNQNQTPPPAPTPASSPDDLTRESFEKLLRSNQGAMEQLKKALGTNSELLRKQASLEGKLQNLESKIDKILAAQNANGKALDSGIGDLKKAIEGIKLPDPPAAPAATDPEPQPGDKTEPATAPDATEAFNLFLAALPEGERAEYRNLLRDVVAKKKQLREKRGIDADIAEEFANL